MLLLAFAVCALCFFVQTVTTWFVDGLIEGDMFGEEMVMSVNANSLTFLGNVKIG